MYERKAYKRLLDWKRSSAGETALLVEGARRVGKTTLAKRFAEREDSASLVIDFAHTSDDVRETFRLYATDLDRFFQRLQALSSTCLKKGDSLVVFDEVQRFPPAREFLKYLVKDGRYHYVETGLLVSIRRNVEDIVIPSEEEALELDPLDFEEWLWAMAERPLADAVPLSRSSGPSSANTSTPSSCFTRRTCWYRAIASACPFIWRILCSPAAIFAKGTTTVGSVLQVRI